MVKCWFGGYKVGGCKNNIYNILYILFLLYYSIYYGLTPTAQTIFNLLTF